MTTLAQVHALIDEHGFTPALVAAWDHAIDNNQEDA